jgi:post-segregation antitoxin (ccd killing protein)
MTKPRIIKKITITLFEDQIEKLKILLAKHKGANISSFLRTVIDKEIENE